MDLWQREHYPGTLHAATVTRALASAAMVSLASLALVESACLMRGAPDDGGSVLASRPAAFGVPIPSPQRDALKPELLQESQLSVPVAVARQFNRLRFGIGNCQAEVIDHPREFRPGGPAQILVDHAQR